ncbi:MAG TPA: ATP-binding protein, partial [Verrucomicrobiae bacterium]
LIIDIASRVQDLSSEVHKLSYQLHPAKLEQLGLVSATRSFCQELSKQRRLPVEFVHDDIARTLSRAVALCVYRIVQESLQNIVKHSRATQARVELRKSADELTLVVSDNGSGIDLKTVGHHAGLGLTGMRERVRLVHGRIAFRSAPGAGMRIEVAVPFAATTTADV